MASTGEKVPERFAKLRYNNENSPKSESANHFWENHNIVKDKWQVILQDRIILKSKNLFQEDISLRNTRSVTKHSEQVNVGQEASTFINQTSLSFCFTLLTRFLKKEIN